MRNKRIKSEFTNDSLYMLFVIGRLKHFSEMRKYWRREAGKCLREYNNEIGDYSIRSKIIRGYFKDLTDKKIVETLETLRLKPGVING